MKWEPPGLRAIYNSGRLRIPLIEVLGILERMAILYENKAPSEITIGALELPNDVSLLTEDWSNDFKRWVTLEMETIYHLTHGKIRHTFIDEYLHLEFKPVTGEKSDATI